MRGMNADSIIVGMVGIFIGITITLLVTLVTGGEYTIISMQDTSYEVIVEGFLGYDELMVVRRLEE
jgi:hypothetical protein